MKRGARPVRGRWGYSATMAAVASSIVVAATPGCGDDAGGESPVDAYGELIRASLFDADYGRACELITDDYVAELATEVGGGGQDCEELFESAFGQSPPDETTLQAYEGVLVQLEEAGARGDGEQRHGDVLDPEVAESGDLEGGQVITAVELDGRWRVAGIEGD